MRGCQRRVLYIKKTDSPIFEEAYFFLRKEGEACEINEGDMVMEANRIIEENIGMKRRAVRKAFSAKEIALFFIGYLVGAIAIMLIFAF